MSDIIGTNKLVPLTCASDEKFAKCQLEDHGQDAINLDSSRTH